MRRGFTIVEVLVAFAVAAIVLGIAYGAFHLLFATGSRHNLVNLTRRSYLQKDAKTGLRRLVYRLREAIQILEPPPGRSGPALVFRDITNEKVRLRLEPADGWLISEIERGGGWVRESSPVTVAAGTSSFPASWPVAMPSCKGVTFTTLSPECISVQAALVHEGTQGSLMTVIKLRNAEIAF